MRYAQALANGQVAEWAALDLGCLVQHRQPGASAQTDTVWLGRHDESPSRPCGVMSRKNRFSTKLKDLRTGHRIDLMSCGRAEHDACGEHQLVC